ncbi:MAG: hypothetical protein J2P36_09355 [Ktedonobacteraceae bacterium]|nr:hypothetical protein [Ktedonobacteraceae bacterium]
MDGTGLVGREPAVLCIPAANAGPLVQTANDARASGCAQAVCKESGASPCGQVVGKEDPWYSARNGASAPPLRVIWRQGIPHKGGPYSS